MRGVTPLHGLLRDDFRISTHTPHARRDLYRRIAVQNRHISTHTPHARRDPTSKRCARATGISTHTPHARRDGADGGAAAENNDFYSHASCEA